MSGAPRPVRHALLCGIAHYADPSRGDLPYVEDEVVQLEKTLKHELHPDFRYDKVDVLESSEATLEALVERLEALSNPGHIDEFFFYLAGHGTVLRQRPYFVTFGSLQSSPGIRLDELGELLVRVNCKTIVGVFDFCHSGALGESIANIAKEQVLTRQIATLSSARREERASPGGTNSFTRCLVSALQSTRPDEDGYVRWGDIATSVCSSMERSDMQRPVNHSAHLSSLRVNRVLHQVDRAVVLSSERQERRSNDVDARLHTVIISQSDSESRMISWHGTVDVRDIVHVCWGYPENPNESVLADITYAPSWEEYPQLVYALIRLGIHGGINTLYVRDPKTWNRRIGGTMPGCLGVRIVPKNWVPAESLSSPKQWSVQPIKPERLPEVPPRSTLLANEVANILNKKMDDWTIARLRKLINDVADGQGHDLLQMGVHASFLEPMRTMWADWQEQLSADVGFAHKFFRLILATNESIDRTASALRVGPKTTEVCLLQATVFALAIAVATRKTRLTIGVRSNIQHQGVAGHLLGLELVDGRDFQDRFGDLTWEQGYAFLASERSDVFQLRAMSRNFNERERSPVTASRKSLDHVRLITRDIQFKEAIQTGPAALAHHVGVVLRRQDEEVKARLENSIDSDGGSDDVN